MYKPSKILVVILLAIMLALPVYSSNDTEAFGHGYTAADDNDNDGYTSSIDCDDNDPNIHPSCIASLGKA